MAVLFSVVIVPAFRACSVQVSDACAGEPVSVSVSAALDDQQQQMSPLSPADGLASPTAGSADEFKVCNRNCVPIEGDLICCLHLVVVFASSCPCFVFGVLPLLQVSRVLPDRAVPLLPLTPVDFRALAANPAYAAAVQTYFPQYAVVCVIWP